MDSTLHDFTNNNPNTLIDEPNSSISSDTVSIQNDETIESVSVSKSQLKRLKRKLMFDMRKKMKKQQKKHAKSNLDTSINSNSNQVSDSSHPIIDAQTRILRREAKLKEFIEKCQQNLTIIIDCSFENLHDEKSLKSLCTQILHLYGFNKNHPNPAMIFITGLQSKISDQLNKSNFSSWKGIYSTSEDFIDLPMFASVSNIHKSESCRAVHTSSQSDEVADHPAIFTNKKTPIYLTSDADETLEELDKDCAYIIGGIVDRNKYKGATLSKAERLGIKTAKLPIGKGTQNKLLNGTHVLTINHVFEILVNYSKSNSWSEALTEVLPQRKELQSSNSSTSQVITIKTDDAESIIDDKTINELNS